MIPYGSSAIRLRGPSFSASDDSSESYDYSGQDKHDANQDAVQSLRDRKFASLYGGDVASAVTAGSAIRGLLKQIRSNTPQATERDPYQLSLPLSRVRSSQSSASRNASAADTVHQNAGAIPETRRKKPEEEEGEEE